MPVDLEDPFAKIRSLPAKRIEQLENFVDFVARPTRHCTPTDDATAASTLSSAR